MSEAIEDLAGPSTRHRPRPLDLVPIDLDAVPFASNALDWSADGVLAAATTDSVHILTPQFITASGSPMPIYDGLASEGNSDQDDDTHDQGDSQFATETGARKQFGGSGRRILVGYPRLDHTINQPLFQEWAAHHPGDDQGQWQADAPKISAGSGSISGSGSTMNSVVSIAWSPSGVGYNERCVLGVLTASGMLIIYGDPLDGGEKDDASTSSGGQRVSGNRNSYDTSRWEVLWAVGERTAVPGQKKPGECITSFAWTNACDAIVEKTPTLAAAYHRAETKALLVYQTDKRDIVVLDVSHSRYIDGRVKWKVAEMERIKAAAGAHLTGQWTRPGAPSVTDFNFVPHSTPFGLHCSPWMVEKVPLGPDLQPESLLTCIIGYTALHYVGFRRLSLVLRPDVSSGRRTIFIDTNDISGFCAFMGANAVLRFEDCLWRVDDDLQTGVPKKRSQCRGVVATPMTIKAFEFEFTAYDPNLVAQATGAPDAHIVFTEGICAATEPSQAEWHTNPISGLIVHPPDPTNHGSMPMYSFVRKDATFTTYEWHGTTLSEHHEPPEWFEIIQKKSKGLQHESVADSEQDTMPQNSEIIAQSSRNRYQVGIWGLAQAPGGLPGAKGTTAVLITEHLIGSSRTGRSRGDSHILFGAQKKQPHQGSSATEPDDSFVNRCDRPATTTEATMWTYMYGGGPEVVPRASFATREGVELNQKCSICDAAINERNETSTCANGHSFDRCTSTGLAIQKPNVSRVCGVCGRKTLVPSALEEILELSGSDQTNKEALETSLQDTVCGFCGGKFFGR